MAKIMNATDREMIVNGMQLLPGETMDVPDKLAAVLVKGERPVLLLTGIVEEMMTLPAGPLSKSEISEGEKAQISEPEVKTERPRRKGRSK